MTVCRAAYPIDTTPLATHSLPLSTGFSASLRTAAPASISGTGPGPSPLGLSSSGKGGSQLSESLRNGRSLGVAGSGHSLGAGLGALMQPHFAQQKSSSLPAGRSQLARDLPVSETKKICIPILRKNSSDNNNNLCTDTIADDESHITASDVAEVFLRGTSV